MLKYSMTISGEPYTAIFSNEAEASQFISDVRNDGDSVAVLSIVSMTPVEVLHCREIDSLYAIELAAFELLPNPRQYTKVWELEDALNKAGYYR